jgi:hypothetical protein
VLVVFEAGSKLGVLCGQAFSQTGLETMVIPASVEVIEKCCFDRCKKLQDVSFERGSKLVRIEAGAFQWSLFKKMNIPPGVSVTYR